MAQFDWLPYLEGKYMTYYQIMSLIFSAIAIFFSLICLTLYLLLTTTHSFPKYRHIFLKLVFHSLSSIPLICMAFDVIGFVEGIFGMSAVLIIGLYVQNNKQRGLYEWIGKGIKGGVNVRQVMKIVGVSLIANLLMYRTCISFYNDEIGYQSQFWGISINTYLMRYIELKTACPVGPPCHMYTTIPQDPHQAFFLNLHTHPSITNILISYRQLQASSAPFTNITAVTIKQQNLDYRAARNVHSALIMGLKPNTKYITKVFYQGKYWAEGIYKTLSNESDVRVRIVNGGDSGYCPAAVKLSKIVATLQPDIFFMGGDIAYDNNIPACSYTWDYFLTMYTQITKTLGYMMPIVTSVGNHDAGINQLSGINITLSNSGPSFLLYFPQHYDRNQKWQIIKQVPPIQHRRTVTTFTFSNVMFMILDSGYLHGFDGWQKQYIYHAMQSNRDKIKFVNYHVPIYSSCQAMDRNPQRFLYALFHWVPLFDKFKVMTVFQNHVHNFKRTKPLISSSPVQKGGTVYLGDGSYGAFNQLGCHPDATIDIFQKVNSNNNFWMTDVVGSRVWHTCYNAQGKKIDEFGQNWEDYRMGEEGEDGKWEHESVDTLLPKTDIFEKVQILAN